MKLQSFLQKKISKGQKTAIIGVGSVLRSDDCAGMHFIEKLSSYIQNENMLLIGGSTAPENFTGVIKNFAPDRLFIVDAAHMGLNVGEIHVLDILEIDGISFSTHMLPLPVMLEFLKLEIGCEVICIGIQPKNTELGFSMCEEVAAASENLAKMFCEAFNG
ncbi:MAG: hydrogenase maturation peptidase HycI [Bacillota bacterium]|nr:hydrogenase maturation peptidase HycI [Bacillota bacterium]